MKIEISKKELQELRELLWEGRAYYAKNTTHKFKSISQHNINMVELGTKYIKKVNQALKKVHGHDCSGDRYI